MRAERNQQVDELFHSALGREPSARPAYLREACGGDAELQSEVASLLAAYEQAGDLMEEPVVEAAAHLLVGHQTRSLIGHQMGHYRITALLGAGGMGEVYLAEDTRLKRRVAIKVLPAHFTADAERLRRFEREAQAAGALNHPNVLSIYDVETHDGAPYVVSELLEGETLREQLGGTPLPTRKAIDYALQIASGLAAAHEKGIVHRDIKPENIFVTRDGRVKILDFGIAKLIEPRNISEAGTDGPTGRLNTDTGAVIGTVGYMSPEQALGKRVDHRSDIFSFGAVVYEMLSGKRAFRGESTIETLSAIIKEDPPDLSTTNNQVAPGLERLVRHCLEKNTEQRFQSARDLAFALESLSTAPSSAGQTIAALPVVARRSKTREIAPWALVALLTIGAIALAFLYLRRPQAEVHSARFNMPMPERVHSGQISLAVSPDGQRVAFVASPEGKNFVWVRPIDSLTAQPLAGTDGVLNLFWSPDSRFIAFFADGKLKKVEATGGLPQTLCDAPDGLGGAWSRDGVIVFAPHSFGGLSRVSASGGVPAQLTTPDESRKERSHWWPSFLPDGRHFLYFALSTREENSGIYVGSLDSNDRTLLLENEASAAYAPPGYLLFVREQMLMAQQFDADRLQLRGEPFRVAEQVGYESQNYRKGFFSVSETGVLVFITGVSDNRRYVWFDRSGREAGAAILTGDLREVVLSPDGRRAAVRILERQGGMLNQDLWIIDLERNVPTRFTFDDEIDSCPVWSPDGSRIVFASRRIVSASRSESNENIYLKLSSGAGNEELLLGSGIHTFPVSWSPDGRSILYYSKATTTNYDVWVLPLFGDRQPFPFLQTEFNERHPHFSPDGRWVAYVSDESGRPEVYVQSFPDAGNKWRISTSGGSQPLWRRDGRELFYMTPDRMIMAVEVRAAGANFETGTPMPLFEARGAEYNFMHRYAVSHDGQRFLINVPPVEGTNSPPITVVLNWTADLNR